MDCYLFISDESLVKCLNVSGNNSYIDVITGNRPAQVKREKRNPVLKRIKRKNTGELSLFLPKVAVYNHRSIWKKIRNFATEFHELKMGLALHSEVWERKEKKAHRNKIDELFLMDGITYISTPKVIMN